MNPQRFLIGIGMSGWAGIHQKKHGTDPGNKQDIENPNWGWLPLQYSSSIVRSASEIEITMVGSREVFEAPMIAGSSEMQVPCNWCILPPFATEDDIPPMWINLTQPPIRVGDTLYTSMFLVVISCINLYWPIQIWVMGIPIISCNHLQQTSSYNAITPKLCQTNIR